MARPTLFTNPKFRRLVRALGSRPLAAGALELMWQPAYEVGDPYVGAAEDIEDVVGWTGAPGALTQALLSAGFIEPYAGDANSKTQHYQIHDFYDHCPRYVHLRAYRERERKLDRVCAHCAQPYRASDQRSRYCNDRCRQADFRIRHGARPVTDIVTDSNKSVTANGPVTDPLRTAPMIVTDLEKQVRDTPPQVVDPQGCHGLVTDCHSTPSTAPAPSTYDLPSEDRTSAPSADALAAVSGTPVEVLEAENGLLTFPVVPGKSKKGEPPRTTWSLTQAMVDEWTTAFEVLDILAECRRALAWVKAKPNRKKTYKGMPAFLNNWFNTSISRGAPSARGPTVITGSLKTAGNKAAIGSFVQRRWGNGVDES